MTSKMVLEKLMAYTSWGPNSRGDPSIVYLDGVTPPTTSMIRSNIPRIPVTKTMSYPLTKANGNHHQQLLQTIREDDSESRGDSSPANRSLDFLEANPPLRTALEARRLRRSSENYDEGLSDSASEEAVTRKSSMESVTSNDSGMASNLSEDGGSRKNSEITVDSSPNPEGNNNSLPKEVSYAELELLKKLEEQNRLIETDAKSLNSLPCQSGHSRRSSETSQISITSGGSNFQENTEEDLWTLWGKIINEWETWSKKKQPQLKELVRRGIPHHFRGMAWQLLCSAHESKDKAKYADYMKRQSACEKVIRRDIARTYPEHDFFKKKDGVGQEALFNVMKAYSIHDREVGYCQGSAFIVGLLLMQMPEEEILPSWLN